MLTKNLLVLVAFFSLVLFACGNEEEGSTELASGACYLTTGAQFCYGYKNLAATTISTLRTTCLSQENQTWHDTCPVGTQGGHCVMDVTDGYNPRYELTLGYYTVAMTADACNTVCSSAPSMYSNCRYLTSD